MLHHTFQSKNGKNGSLPLLFCCSFRHLVITLKDWPTSCSSVSRQSRFVSGCTERPGCASLASDCGAGNRGGDWQTTNGCHVPLCACASWRRRNADLSTAATWIFREFLWTCPRRKSWMRLLSTPKTRYFFNDKVTDNFTVQVREYLSPLWQFYS